MSKRLRIALLAVVAIALGLAFLGLRDGEDEMPRARLLETLGSVSASLSDSSDPGKDSQSEASVLPGLDRNHPGNLFTSAAPDYVLSFPEDYGSHPDYQTEWWYYTGNLVTQEGRRFGYQLTFFRRALVPPDERTRRTSAWAADQVYLAHLALSDIEQQEFHAFEELSRAGAGLAGAQAEPFQAWLYDWQVSETAQGVYRLSAAQDGYGLDLSLTDVKGPVPQGIDGYSQKGPEPGNASIYFSQTRLETQGGVILRGEDFAVSGTSWMDHEFSTSALSPDLVGWDWFSIQLEDGSELMAYLLRRKDGTVDPYSSANYIDLDGRNLYLEREDFSIQVLDEWKSPHSAATYPSRWRLSVPELGLSLEIQPYQADQELNLAYSYWEGAVGVSGVVGGKVVSGNGYVELTGYAGSLGGDF